MGLRLFHAESWSQAREVVDVLAQKGIMSWIESATSSAAGSARSVSLGSSPEVWLMHPDQQARARGAVSDYLSPCVPTALELCGACDEENPTTLSRCWGCGRPLAVRKLCPAAHLTS